MNNPLKAQKTNRLRAFTLIELLGVISIIVILSGLVIGVAGFVQQKAATTKAKAQFKLVEMALEEYKRDAGVLPSIYDKEGLSIYMMLFGDGVGEDGILSDEEAASPLVDGEPDLIGAGPGRAEVYLAELDPASNSQKMLKLRSSGEPVPVAVVDPWGKPWRFRSGADNNPMNPDFDIWSAGGDAKWDTDDDIKNW